MFEKKKISTKKKSGSDTVSLGAASQVSHFYAYKGSNYFDVAKLIPYLLHRPRIR